MMFGREPIFPIADTELLLTDSNETEQPTNEEITVAMDRLHSLQREMHSTAATNIKKAQIKQKSSNKAKKTITTQGMKYRVFQSVIKS